MSAAGRGGERAPEDSYDTPPWCVRRLLEAVRLPGGHWVEPCAGRGCIIDAVAAVRGDVRWTAFEIRTEAVVELTAAHPEVHTAQTDFLLDPAALVPGPTATVVLANPPYSLALEFIARAGAVAPHAWLVFLLRVNFLAGEARADFMRADVPDLYVLPNRPSFRNGGTDATEYAWFMWQPRALRELYGPRRFGQHVVLASTPVAERRGLAA